MSAPPSGVCSFLGVIRSVLPIFSHHPTNFPIFSMFLVPLVAFSVNLIYRDIYLFVFYWLWTLVFQFASQFDYEFLMGVYIIFFILFPVPSVVLIQGGHSMTVMWMSNHVICQIFLWYSWTSMDIYIQLSKPYPLLSIYQYSNWYSNWYISKWAWWATVHGLAKS